MEIILKTTMKTKIYNNILHGDWVKCSQCGAIMLLPCGADQCPECCGCGTLSWIDEARQEMNVDDLGADVLNTNHTLKPEDYLDPETLAMEFPEYYKQLKTPMMEHTDFYCLVKRIKQMEYKEVFEAIQAHGGFYEWDVNSDSYPIIAVNIDSICPNPMDVVITKAYVKNNILCLEGEDKEYGNPVQFSCDEVFAGHLSYILDYLPATSTVDSVKSDFSTNVLFGQDAVRAYENGSFQEFVDSYEEYSHIVRIFDTPEEQQAYLTGLNDMDGWHEYQQLESHELLEDPNISYE